MYSNIEIEITTKSNLLIGGNPVSFEIGGIDQCTIVDCEGYPIIPASSFKGCLRFILKNEFDDDKLFEKLENYYSTLLQKELENLMTLMEERILGESDELIKNEIMKEKESYKSRYKQAIDNFSIEYLFGIEGFNNTPKLMFSDFSVKDKQIGANKEDLFSKDAKNTIKQMNNDISANPRIYKTVRPEVTFCGEIYFYKIKDDDFLPELKENLKKVIELLNNGIYRLGNSKSRGYGRVQAKVLLH